LVIVLELKISHKSDILKILQLTKYRTIENILCKPKRSKL